ncbi:hypothetical protein FRC17_004855 [Serendipita sp. 399]|nr:hypothetical protein FRC17_004855 [Serendipita sp. 399]
MQVQPKNSSEEDLSKYEKRGYEYVEEEKVALDEIVLLYRKRLEVMQNHLKALEEVHAMAMASFNPASTLHELLIVPILECLQKDLQGQKKCIQDSEEDLESITFPPGPYRDAGIIKKDLKAVEPLYSEYKSSYAAVLEQPPPSLPTGEKWPSEAEDIKHRQVTAKLHSKQKVARMHFDVAYPILLDDHMEYMEQVKRLTLSNTMRRSELSTTIASNASTERMLLEDKFSTTDAIAVPHMKMDLERDRREYQHAPVLNLLTRKLEEGRTVIMGRDLEFGSADEPVEEVILACVKRWPTAKFLLPSSEYLFPARDPRGKYPPFRNYWEIIHAIEADSRIIMTNTQLTSPLVIGINDEESMKRLLMNYWIRPVAMNLMKRIDPRIKRVFKACASAYIYEYFPANTLHLILRTRDASLPSDNMWGPILHMWDHEMWRPLPDEVWWRQEQRKKGWGVYRMKRFLAKPGYFEDKYRSSHWVWLEVDENGDAVDTPENQEKMLWIKEPSIKKKKTSQIAKFLRKLNT